MGKLRKKQGKRAWRKIDTSKLEDDLERVTREERHGLAFERVPDADLFFVDKGGDEETAAAVAEGQLPAGTADGAGGRKLRARAKVLRSQAILAALGGALPPSKVVSRKQKGPAAGLKQQQQQQQQAAKRKGRSGGAAAAPFDLWADGDDAGVGALPPRLDPASFAPKVLAPPALVEAAAISAKRRRTGAKPGAAAPHIPALEIDAAGCSFNPDPEAHQDAVAAAVADEVKKQLQKELEPKAPPRTVDYDVERDELAMLQTLEDPGEVDGEGGERQQQQLQQGGEGGGQQREQEEDGEEEDEEGGAEAARRRAAAQRDRKTKKDRNKEARKRAAEEVAAAAAAVKRQRRELDALPSLVEEVKDIEAEVEERRARRAADRAERVAAAPPRLGKLPFEPMPLQVLTTSEVSGSLRRLRPTAALAKDRFKSLQKRGAIEPRKRIPQKSGRKKVEFTRGERPYKAQEQQQEIEELRAAKRAAKKAGADAVF